MAVVAAGTRLVLSAMRVLLLTIVAVSVPAFVLVAMAVPAMVAAPVDPGIFLMFMMAIVCITARGKRGPRRILVQSALHMRAAVAGGGECQRECVCLYGAAKGKAGKPQYQC